MGMDAKLVMVIGVLSKFGVEVFNEDGTFRDLIDIFDGLASAWCEMDKADKTSIVDTLVGFASGVKQ